MRTKADGRGLGRRLRVGAAFAVATLSGASVAGPEIVRVQKPDVAAPADTLLVMVELTQAPTAQIYDDLLRRGPRAALAATAAAVDHLRVVRDEQRAFDRELGRAGLKEVKEIYRLQRTYNGVALKVRRDEMRKLASLPGVKGLHVLTPKRLSNARSMPFLGVPAVWESLGLNGEGIKVGIIDTGIDYLHANFGGNGDYSVDLDPTVIEANTFPTTRVVGGWDFAGAGYDPMGELGPPQDIPHPDPDPMDFFGHGTHVAGTVGGYGVTTADETYGGPWDATTDMSTFHIGPGAAPLVDLYALKVFGDGPDGSNIIELAVEWATDPNEDGSFDDHLDVVNLSVGGVYGSSADPSQIIYGNAVRAGVTVVAAAGNGNYAGIGDVYFIHSNPAGTPEVIAVAAIHHDGSVYPATLRVLNPTSAVADYPAVLQDWALPLDTTGLIGDLTLTDPPDLCEAPVNDMAGKIAVIDIGTCDLTAKALNAQLAGAAGAVVISPYLGFAFADAYTDYGLPVTIPVAVIELQDGQALKSGMAADLLTVNLSSNPLPVPGEADRATFFSSRGPSRAGSHLLLKPDVSAPGIDIMSSVTRMAAGGQAWGGTSMATPHVAGIMALLREGRPTWSPQQLKAALMNTSNHDVMTFGHGAMPVSPSRGGAGRVDPAAALDTLVIAYDADAPASVSLSFHTLDVVGSTSEARTVRLENRSSGAISYSVSYVPVVAPPGVTITVPSTNVLVAANHTLDVPVTLNVDASALVRTHDATVDPNGRFWLSEASGYVVFKPLTGQSLRVPVFAALRPASDMSAVGPVDTTDAVDGVGSSSITLAGTGLADDPATPPDWPYAVDSLVWPFELMYRSPDEAPAYLIEPPDGYDPVETNVGDLKAVGVNNTTVYGDPPNNALVLFGLETYGIWGSPSELRFDVYLKKESAPDWQWVALNLDFGPEISRGDVHSSCWFTPAFNEGWCFPDSLNVFGSTRHTPVFLSDALVLVFPTEFLEMEADESVIEFQVVVHAAPEHNIGAPVDTTPILRYDLARPGVSFPVDAVFPDLPDTEIAVNYDLGGALANRSGGVLLLHHHNANGTRGEIVNVDGMGCTTDDECPPSIYAQVCDPYNGACVGCLDNTVCYPGESCDMALRECVADCRIEGAVDCAPGGYCDVYTGACVADCREPTAVPCIAGSFCREDTGQCQVANALVSSVTLEAGNEHCPSGGLRIDSGLDLNGNAILDGAEVLTSEYVCNALETLVVTTDEPAGENCEWGGQRVASGVDGNGNGLLEEEEIEEISFACNGPDGFQTLVTVTDEAPGESCPAGGKRIDIGVDDDRDAELDPAEIDETTYQCNAIGLLSVTSAVPPGEACAEGGTLVQTGLDANGDGELVPSEVASHQVICNGAPTPAIATAGGGCSLEGRESGRSGRGALGSLALVGLVLVRRRPRR